MSQADLARAARVAQPNISAYENGRRQPSPEVLERIRRALAGTLNERLFRHRDEIHRLVAEHHATAPRVFGSVARGEDTSASDIDILVDFTPEAGLLDEVACASPSPICFTPTWMSSRPTRSAASFGSGWSARPSRCEHRGS